MKIITYWRVEEEAPGGGQMSSWRVEEAPGARWRGARPWRLAAAGRLAAMAGLAATLCC
jgi:hypothetical protein